jgi:hypothetical protein
MTNPARRLMLVCWRRDCPDRFAYGKLCTAGQLKECHTGLTRARPGQRTPPLGLKTLLAPLALLCLSASTSHESQASGRQPARSQVLLRVMD